jgi:DNA-directed RNA polymerase specialized sigma24 family protein
MRAWLARILRNRFIDLFRQNSLSKSILLAAITTLRPFAASCLDSSFPIPEDAPVTSETSPVSGSPLSDQT